MAAMENTSKKVRIVAAWLIAPDFHRGRTADALGVSKEYIRQIVNSLEVEMADGRVSSEEMERAQDQELQAAVASAMREEDAFRSEPPKPIPGEAVEVPVEKLEEELTRLRHLEESAMRGDPERAWLAGSAREFLEDLVTAK